MINVKENVPLASLTTFKVGGAAEYFAAAKSEAELRELVMFAHERQLPMFVLGGGSNVVVSDDGIKGLVVKNEIEGIDYTEKGSQVLVTAGSGVLWDALVSDTVQRGLWGMENLSAIPGTVGATPIQNVGAYGIEVGELIESVRVYDMEGDRFLDMSSKECQFGYRDSFFKTEAGKRYVVCRVTYRLSKEPKPILHYKDLSERFSSGGMPSLSEIRQAVIEIRAGKFPDLKRFGTAGSFFKNPIVDKEVYDTLKETYPDLPGFPQADNMVKVPLGFVLDKICNLRGAREGNVGTYEKQSLVLVNHGGATTDEIKEFAKKISDKVFEKTKIKIEWEASEVK